MLAPWVAWRNKTPRGTRGVRGAAVAAIRSRSRSSATGSWTSTAPWCAPSARPRAKRAGSSSAASLAELPEVNSDTALWAPGDRARGTPQLFARVNRRASGRPRFMARQICLEHPLCDLKPGLGIERPGRLVVLEYSGQDEAGLLSHPLRGDVPGKRHEADHSEMKHIEAPLTDQGESSSCGPAVAGPRGGPIAGNRGTGGEVHICKRHRSEQLSARGVAEGEGRASLLVPKSIVQSDPFSCVVLFIGFRDASRPTRDLRVLTGSGHRRNVVEGEPAQGHHSVGKGIFRSRKRSHG